MTTHRSRRAKHASSPFTRWTTARSKAMFQQEHGCFTLKISRFHVLNSCHTFHQVVSFRFGVECCFGHQDGPLIMSFVLFSTPSKDAPASSRQPTRPLEVRHPRIGQNHLAAWCNLLRSLHHQWRAGRPEVLGVAVT